MVESGPLDQEEEDMVRVVLVGDTHSDATFVSNVNRFARDNEAPTVVQLGDFGHNFDRNVLASITAFLDRDEANQWLWLDGNHDHHDYIEEVILKDEHSWTSPVSHFHDRMFYCPRGSTTTLGDTKVMFLGGAYSIDKEYRKAHVSWWPQEMIRPKDMENAFQNKEGVTVMFTHDVPPNAALSPLLHDFGYKVDSASRSNRDALAAVVDVVHPDRLYHGHYHHRYDGHYVAPDGWVTKIRGVAANYVHDRHEPRALANVNVLLREF